jgi:nucleoside-diphosphate-sugar epimerase
MRSPRFPFGWRRECAIVTSRGSSWSFLWAGEGEPVRCLVTGGAGFLGAHVLRRLLEDDRFVVCYDGLPSPNAVDEVLPPADRSRVIQVSGEITDLPALLRTCQEHRIDTVIHLAHILGIRDENPLRSLEVNCKGAINVFEAATLLGLRRVVWAASTAVWGAPDRYPYEYLPDDAPQYPATVYGMCKSFVERLAEYYRRERGVSSGAARFPVIYGPGRRRGGATYVRDLIVAAVSGERYSVPFPEELQNFLYVEDAARCLVMLSEVDRTETPVYNVSGRLATVWEFAEAARRCAPEANFVKGGGRFEPFAWKYRVDAIQREIGFETRIDLDDGVRRCIEAQRRVRDA